MKTCSECGWPQDACCCEPLVECNKNMPDFVLTHEDLQEIHKLTGMVCGWKMSLPSKMISQAQAVHRRVIGLEIVKNQNPKEMGHKNCIEFVTNPEREKETHGIVDRIMERMAEPKTNK